MTTGDARPRMAGRRAGLVGQQRFSEASLLPRAKASARERNEKENND